MAARVLLRQRSLATLALGAAALAPATIQAEAPFDKRKPIYEIADAPADNAAVTTLSRIAPSPRPVDETKAQSPTPTDRLALQIGKARLFLYRYAVCAEDQVNQTMDSAFHLEQSFTNTIASLAPSPESGERLMPGAIYVLVAAMAGSIITRNRNVLLRVSVPLALGIGAGWVVLPVTMKNISDLVWKYEQRFPAVAESHAKLDESLQHGLSTVRLHAQMGVRYVDDKVTEAREVVEGWVKQGK